LWVLSLAMALKAKLAFVGVVTNKDFELRVSSLAMVLKAKILPG